MTTKEIESRIEGLKERLWDFEWAHGEEDDLYREFIEYVATLKTPSLAAKAKLVLSTQDLDFERHCA